MTKFIPQEVAYLDRGTWKRAVYKTERALNRRLTTLRARNFTFEVRDEDGHAQAAARADQSPTMRAVAYAHTDSVRADLVIERIGTRDQRSADEAKRAAAAYRLAAELTEMNVAVGACIALDVDARDGRVTIELAAGTDPTVAHCLMGDALAALRIPAEWRNG